MKLSLPGRFGTTYLVIGIVAFGLLVCSESFLQFATTMNCGSANSAAMSTRTANDVAWAVDGRHVVSRSRGCSQGTNAIPVTVAIHDLASGTESTILWNGESEVSALHATLSPDGKYLLIATAQRQLLWLRVSSSETTCLAELPMEAFTSTAISHDGNIRVGVTDFGQIHLFDLKQNHSRQLTVSPRSLISKVQFSQNDERLLTACNDGSVHVWDVGTNELLRTTRLSDPGKAAATFLPDGEHVLSAIGSDRVAIWDVKTGQLCWNVPHGFDGSTGVRSIDVSTDGSTAVWAGIENQIEIWDLHGFARCAEIENPSNVINLQLSPDGRQLAVAGRESVIRIYDARNGKEAAEVDTTPRMSD